MFRTPGLEGNQGGQILYPYIIVPQSTDLYSFTSKRNTAQGPLLTNLRKSYEVLRLNPKWPCKAGALPAVVLSLQPCFILFLFILFYILQVFPNCVLVT